MAAAGLSVSKAARGSGSGAEGAFELMASMMKSHGIDMLYELSLKSTRAKTLLADPEVRKRGSEALQIAYDMRDAKGCQAKAALLERDGRSWQETDQ